jgi:hypothetical protein
MADMKTYSGSCHCGKVAYDVTMDLGEVVACNCSICSRMGWLLAFVPSDQFTLRSGGDALTDYQFAKKHIHHLFCSTCGVNSFSRGAGPGGKEMFSVNVRCLEGVDADKLQIRRYNGKDH